MGRFLQTDPAGDGMNLYVYCVNNPLNCVDPSGLYWTFLDMQDRINIIFLYHDKLVFAWIDDNGNIDVIANFNDLASWYLWAPDYFSSNEGYAEDWDMTEQIGYELSERWSPKQGSDYDQDWFFWRLQAMRFLSGSMESVMKQMEDSIGIDGRQISIRQNTTDVMGFGGGPNGYIQSGNTITLYWDPNWDRNRHVPNLVTLAHEFSHGLDFLYDGRMYASQAQRESVAIGVENGLRAAYMSKVPFSQSLGFRRP